jgi:pimeloyl-ACP methyl ester carboxylesterase
MEELLHTWTEDGLRLEGVRYGPSSSELAIVYTHGATSSFLRPTHVTIGRALARDGFTVIAGNNRGSGLATVFQTRSGERICVGTWFERLADGMVDIAAWIDLAAAAGAKRVVLLGHSLGAAKAVLYASERPDPRLAGLVLASPAFHLVSGERPVDPQVVERARRAVEAGRPAELVDLGDFPLIFGRMSAATVLDYATGRANVWGPTAPRLRAVGCPVLGFYGTSEPAIGGQAELERIAHLVRGSFTAMLITGADHMYIGHEEEAAAVVANWIRGAVVRSSAAASASAG